ncbi:piezo-type mechanosensitive ion channel component 2 isoform X3 [Homo sapiens]|uniref:piezo-type mechanosensitive ion channel component 2 isoform X3 n=1 Tax=Homo sapiens TaxID=9606 RepID=UPI0005D03C00|nr:piezo-type mechanosensitive ion channel component 2 isoform X3 [Homo sapiens]XP_054174946.1 piezo-type mechanosensitive ion channel component 2 isoform X3 [Homo sapiens]|eukprot:XP_011524027.1 piezo-type mechanosensitive ion channel component 2 isoform X4 [Homo sapiens]
MASEVVCGLIFRLLLPICLAVACAFRYNGLSFVYLIYLLLIPLFSEPTKTTMQGHTGRLLKSLCFISLSFLLLHIIFHITLVSLEAQHRIAPGYNCSTWEKTFRQIGFESLKGADAGNGIRVFVPDIGMFIASLTIWLLCRNIVQKPVTDEAAQSNPEFENEELAEGEKIDSEEALIYEEDFNGGDGVEGELEESTKLKMFRRLASVASKLKEFIGNMITTAGKVVVTILLGSSGMMLPSLTSSVYFFVFLGLCTWWSWCRTFDPLLFSCLCVLLAIFTAGHLIGLYLYQFQFFQEAVPPNDYYARLFGIKSVIQTDCSSTWKIIVNPDLSWYHHANPILLLVMYYTLATLIRIWLQEPLVQDEGTKEEDKALACSPIQITAGRRRSLWYATHYPTDERKLLSMTQDDYKPSDGLLVTVNGNPVDYHTIHPSLPMENGPGKADLYSTPQYRWEPSDESSEKREEEEEEKEEFEEERSREEKRSIKVHAMVSVFQFIMKQSYICALIAMMAWSITYHSWLTFVLLIWSCTLWMIRNRRKYAMISSPFMVVYGNLLLILQYIWSFELPEIKKVPGFLEKKEPGELASKILFTITFWLLLRQHLTEQKALQEKEALLSEVKIGSQENEEKDEELQDIQVEGEPKEEEEEEAKEEKQERKKVEQEEAEEEDEQDIMKVLGNLVVAMFIKYWIYVCGGMFFFVSFEGKIVMYKIIYMVLFLFCVALYQVHYEWWRKILKYFWMSVVIYTMLVLIFIYTYQFENFPGLWQNMTGLKKEKLEDLGLKQFTVAELFTRIFIPTSFLLVCILHLHYFHDRFLELTDLKSIPSKEDNTIYSHAKVNGRVYLIINRLAHPEGSLPDLTMMHLTASLEKPEVRKLAEPGEEKLEGYSEKAQKGDLGKDSEESEEDGEEEEESEEEEETSDLRNKWHLVIDRLTVLFLKFLEYFHKLQVFMWWILELHIIKIVSSYIIWVSVKEVSLFNYVFLISWAFALPYAKLRRLASSVCTVWTCVIIVCKMLYQLQTIKPENFSVNCSLPNENQTNIPFNELNKSLLYSAPIDPTEWVGLRKSSPLLVYLRNNLLMLAILAFEVTIYRHQEYYRGRNNLTAPVSRTIFHDITRLHLDDGLINCAKYFINYFFYKFGLETCFLMSVNVIGQRMDFYAMIHACWLIAVLYRRRRKAIAEIWPKYCCFLACIITFQYFICIGIPPAPCRDYPWRFKGASFNDNIIKWLYFPDFIVRPNPVFLVYDFMLLLCASLQRQIFEDENKAAVRIMAGDNVEICMNLDAASFSQHNPVPDFIHCRSYLDMSKVIIFSYLFWFVLTIIFITGTTRISIFCMGYLVACFYFLLFGGDLLLKPIKSILRYWDWLIAYNVFVITMKNILSIGACGYIGTLVHNSCWLIQAFSLACTVKGYQMPAANSPCTLPSGEAGIIWDSICFAFLLLQRRVFMSYYFLHVVADIKASQILASRGAELFQATIVKAVKARIEEEKKSMDQLKRQMDRIKARQQKYKKGKERMLSLTQEPGEGQDMQKLSEEDDEREADKQKAKGKKKQWWRPWVDHASMVRSGDYYLFETDSEEEEEEELKKEDEEPPRRSAFQFVYQAWITDPKTALRQRHKEKKRSAREERKRRRKGSKEGPVEWEDREDEPIKKKSDGPDNIIKRIFNILKFTWVLFLATVDSFTTWLNSISREHIDISTVLRIERCMLTREIKKGNVPTRESIHMYYQNHIMNLSRESGLDTIDEHPGAASGAQTAHRMDSLDSHDSISSEPTQCTMLYSRQGTTETIEEVEAEQEEEAGSTAPEPREAKEYEATGYDVGAMGAEEASLTPEEELTQFSTLDGDVEAPPSYSKAVSFEHLSFGSQDDSAGKNRMAVSPDDSRTDKLGSSILPPLTHELTASELLLKKMFHDDELEESEKFYVGQPRFLLLFYAMYNTLVARSEMVCYFVIILNHMVSASMITLLLPILIFLWAMLSVPRPSRRFWMMAIVYTEVAIVVKYFFQFGFFPWNKNVEVNKDKPYHPPNIIGVEKKEGYVLYDLIQLLALFFHRSILKCHGLWDEDDMTESGMAREESDDELSLGHGRRDSSDSLKSINLAASVESVHVTFPEQQTAVRRKRSGSSSEPSQRSSFSSNRSQRGSTSTRNSSQKGSSVLSIKQKGKRELYMEKLQEHLIKAKAFTIKKTLEIYVPIKQFFYNLIHPEYSAVTDVYVLMFLADTVDFIIIVFGFWAFGKHSAAADITSSLSEDQVPGPFLVMVLIQFGTMVVDRALYLRKTVLGKVIFQVILVFGIHFWMFFILPGVTERKFSQNLVAQLWYFVKCVYFGLSAYQIRCGYPTRVLGNFLTKSYNYVNLFLFQGFRLVPFLTELRAVMDWVWTDTTLSLSSWICVEDIYAHIFILKCWRESEKRYPQPRGQKKKKVVKYGMGGMIIVLLICIVWFPLLFMSLIKSVAGVINQPLDVSVTITLGGYQPIFTMSAQQSQLKVMDQQSFNKFIQAFSRDTGAMQFLENYEKEDITVAELEGNSNSLWTISPPSKQKMIHELLDPNSSFSVVFSWSIQRNLSLGAKSEIATDKLSFPLKNITRKNIAKMIAGNSTESSKTPVTIEKIYPYYVKAPSDSNSKPIKQLLSENNFMDITIILSRDNTTKYNSEWWVLNLTGNRIYNPNSQALELVVFNDKVSPPSLGFLAGYGIMGLYASVVLVIGKFVREFFSGISHSIMFEELPNVDRILKLCTDIFLVRETGELELEEDLYAKLIFLYRSPETMIKWTREKTN